MNQNKTHYYGGLLTFTLSTLLEKGDFNRGLDRIQTPGFFVFFSNRTLTGHNGGFFTRYPVNSSVNGNLNRGRLSFLMECFKKN